MVTFSVANVSPSNHAKQKYPPDLTMSPAPTQTLLLHAHEPFRSGETAKGEVATTMLVNCDQIPVLMEFGLGALGGN